MRNSAVAKKLTFEDAQKIASAFGGVERSTTYGTPALKVNGNLIACIPSHKSAEPGSLAVSVDFVRRAELLETAPEIYYVKEHYLNYPVVLVRMWKIDSTALRDLLHGAWLFASAKKKARAKRNR
jgi:hypothetical protein